MSLVYNASTIYFASRSVSNSAAMKMVRGGGSIESASVPAGVAAASRLVCNVQFNMPGVAYAARDAM